MKRCRFTNDAGVERAVPPVRMARSPVDPTPPSWPGITTEIGRFAETELYVDGRMLGHVHGDRVTQRTTTGLWRTTSTAGSCANL